MSIRGVKFITRVAACLGIFDKQPREPETDTEIEPVSEPKVPVVAAERLSLRVFPSRRIAQGPAALGIA